jgi:hypothetical protein
VFVFKNHHFCYDSFTYCETFICESVTEMSNDIYSMDVKEITVGIFQRNLNKLAGVLRHLKDKIPSSDYII